VKEIVAPAELPATYTAYKAQQRRWTQGWVQLQRLHLGTLVFRYRTSVVRKLNLLHHMCISWQWPFWALWVTILPALIFTGHWFGSLGATIGVLLYLLPSVAWITVAAAAASIETKHTYADAMTPASLLSRLRRVVPYLVITTGMLPHQLTAFAEGLFGPMHSEFERTPKAGSVSAASTAATVRQTPPPKTYRVKVHWPYVVTDAGFAAYQAAWMVVFASNGLVWCSIGAGAMAASVLFLAFQYGDHLNASASLSPAYPPGP
jgi:hypothetical protein